MLEVEEGVVRRLHDVTIGDADTQTVRGRSLVEARSGTGDETGGAARIKDGLFGGRGN